MDDYRKVLIHGETEDQIDDDDRYLTVETKQGSIVLHTEDDEVCVDTVMEIAEALELIRSLTEAIQRAM